MDPRTRIEALTMADVEAAKARAVEARRTRSGLSTVDFHLSQVGNSPRHTLEAAKAALVAALPHK